MDTYYVIYNDPAYPTCVELEFTSANEIDAKFAFDTMYGKKEGYYLVKVVANSK